MAQRRIVLLWTQPLLRDSLKFTLKQLPEVTLVACWFLNVQVLTRLNRLQVDLVIVAGGDEDMLANLLIHHSELPLIRVSLTHNLLQIFTSQTVPARSADLIDLIQQTTILNK